MKLGGKNSHSTGLKTRWMYVISLIFQSVYPL